MYASVAIATLAVAASGIHPIDAAPAGADVPAALTWTGEILPGSGNVILTGDDIQVGFTGIPPFLLYKR